MLQSRKLEFLLADAVQKKCTAVATIGSMQSNHCRTTALTAALLGLECHLVLSTKDEDPVSPLTFLLPLPWCACTHGINICEFAHMLVIVTLVMESRDSVRDQNIIKTLIIITSER